MHDGTTHQTLYGVLSCHTLCCNEIFGTGKGDDGMQIQFGTRQAF